MTASQLIEPKTFKADLKRPYIDMVTPAPTISFTLCTAVVIRDLDIDFDCQGDDWATALKHVGLYREMNYTPEIAAVAQSIFSPNSPTSLDANCLGESNKERFIKRLFGTIGPWRMVGDYYSLDLTDPALAKAD